MLDRPDLLLREQAEVEALLASGLFARAPNLASFLTYVCQRYFAGEADGIKEYNIAVEALGRPAEFDQKRDSIVRVEAHRLRRRLRTYYEGEGAAHAIHIDLPAGSYAPVFHHRTVEDAVLAAAAGVVPVQGFHAPVFSPPRSEAREPPIETPNPSSGAQGRAAASFVSSPWRSGALLASLLALLLLGWAAWMTARSRGVRTTSSSMAATSASLTETNSFDGQPGDATSEVRIAAGATANLTDAAGRVWFADRFAEGGRAGAVSPREIHGTLNQALYSHFREGTEFRYEIPTRAGVYELYLHFMEPRPHDLLVPTPSATSRLFDVSVNGQPLLQEFDILTEAGGADIATVRCFRDILPAPDGKIHLSFSSRDRGQPRISGIELLPGTPGRLRPLRIAMREAPYTDVNGRVWLEDRYFTAGRIARRTSSVEGTPDQDLFRAERYGEFVYNIPVPSQSLYTVTLHFAETWFGGKGPSGDENRLFDVLCNGRTLLQNFNVTAEAKGPFRAIQRVFKHLKPTVNGRLRLQFIPSRNYAMVNAIEVIDEKSLDTPVSRKADTNPRD